MEPRGREPDRTPDGGARRGAVLLWIAAATIAVYLVLNWPAAAGPTRKVLEALWP